MTAESSWASSTSVRAVMRGNRGRDTDPELAVRRLLHGRGLRYRVAYRLTGSRRTLDIAFTRRKVAVLIDGCFWHGCPDHYRPARTNAAYWGAKIRANRARDADTTSALREAGWTVLRFWEHEDPVAVADKIEEVLRMTVAPGRFTLDAFQADAAAGGDVLSWPAARFGEPWNGWATPLVTRDVLAAVMEAVTAATGEPHRWDGEAAIIVGPVDATGEPEYEDRLEPEPDGVYDLGRLGWTWVHV